MNFVNLVKYIKSARVTADDPTALLGKEFYPEWDKDIEITQEMIDKGENRYQYGDKLYKCKQAHTTQSDWTPDVTASLWDIIDAEHAGTLDDPIPYDPNMVVYDSKYYIYDGVVYKCIRDSGIPLYTTPDTLLHNYFELV